MGGCQLRDGQGQTRHMYLVLVAYSLLVRELRHLRTSDWAFEKLETIGEACRAMANEPLGATLNWALRHIRQPNIPQKNMFKQLGLV